jgi:hypothetical protein
MVNGISKAPLLSNTATIAFDCPVFVQGQEGQKFSLEVWVNPITNDANEQQVLGTNGNMDGITVVGTKIRFTTKYLTAADARCEYDLQQLRRVHAVGIHTKYKNMLFINGVLVDEVTLTEAQVADQFKATNGKLYSGVAGAVRNISVNGVAAYASALSAEVIQRHYKMGSLAPTNGAVTNTNRGVDLNLSLDENNVFLDQWWSTEEDWKQDSQFVNTVVTDDRLGPMFNGDVSMAGNWKDTVALSAVDSTSIYGVIFNWDGVGATVEVSLDETSWETVTRGKKITTIPAGFDPTGKVLIVRVSFPGGITNDTSYLDNLNAVILKSGVFTTLNARTVTVVGGTQEREYPVLDQHENWGVELPASATLTISGDPSTDAIPARTVEYWVKRTAATAPVSTFSGTSYVNGVAGSTLPLNQWAHFVTVGAANVTGAITITGPGQIGHVGIYDYAMTAAQVAALYSEYYDTNAQRIRDTSVIGVTESASGAKIYAQDWTIYTTS